MYADGGHLYVFSSTACTTAPTSSRGREGVAEAVLLRAAEPPGDAPARLLAGPGKLCSALGISVRHSGLGTRLADSPVRIFVPLAAVAPLGVSPRVGVDYAGDAKDWPLRFFDKRSDSVSK